MGSTLCSSSLKNFLCEKPCKICLSSVLLCNCFLPHLPLQNCIMLLVSFKLLMIGKSIFFFQLLGRNKQGISEKQISKVIPAFSQVSVMVFGTL